MPAFSTVYFDDNIMYSFVSYCRDSRIAFQILFVQRRSPSWSHSTNTSLSHFLDKPLRSTSCALVQELSQQLNPHGRWKVLAGRLGFSQLQISNFALDPVTATEKMLTEWGHGMGATLLTLQNILKEMKWKREANIVAMYM